MSQSDSTERLSGGAKVQSTQRLAEAAWIVGPGLFAVESQQADTWRTSQARLPLCWDGASNELGV